MCEPAYLQSGGGAAGLALQFFVLSNCPRFQSLEMPCSLCCLRSLSSSFSWYHHLTVLVFCWQCYVNEASMGHFFASTVHAIIYFYFYMQAIKAVPKWFPSWMITLIPTDDRRHWDHFPEHLLSYFRQRKIRPGACTKTSTLLIHVGSIIYSSDLYLFVEFAFTRVVSWYFTIIPSFPMRSICKW